MLASMDWQKPAALCVVALTAAVFLWSRWGKALGCGSGPGLRWGRGRWKPASPACGCAGAATQGAPGLIVRGRRGERPQVVFR